jgi:hypothetical protein
MAKGGRRGRGGLEKGNCALFLPQMEAKDLWAKGIDSRTVHTRAMKTKAQNFSMEYHHSSDVCYSLTP